MIANRTNIEAQIAMLDDAIAGGSPFAEVLQAKRAELVAQLGSAVTETPADYNEQEREVGRRAGSPASNQFGTFTVHAATEAQLRFLRKLVDTKDLESAPESKMLGPIVIPTDFSKLSKTSASALIDRLVKLNDKAAAAAPFSAASEKQVAFIVKLAGEKDWEDLAGGVDARNVQDALAGRPVDRKTVSGTIDWLLGLRRKPVAAAAPQVELAAGAYRLADGRIVRVYLGQQSGKMLAAELADITAEHRDDAWHYLGMATRFVPADAHRMTVDECEALVGDADHSWCCVCGRRLDDPNSVSRSIGPVCRAKQGGC